MANCSIDRHLSSNNANGTFHIKIFTLHALHINRVDIDFQDSNF